MSDASTIVRQAAVLVQSGKLAEARGVLLRAVQQGKSDKTTLQLLRQVLSRMGESAQAMFYAEKLHALDKNDPEGVNVLAASLGEAGKADQAIALLEASIAAHPTYLMNRGLLANHYARRGRFFDAAELAGAGLQLTPGEPRLSGVFASALLHLGRSDEAVLVLKQAVSAAPGDPNLISLLASVSNYAWSVDRKDLFAAHCAYGRVLAGALPSSREPFTQSFDPERRLRVAFVGGDFHDHPAMMFIEPIIERLDRSAFEVLIFSSGVSEDGVTDRIRGHASVWRSVVGKTVVDAARLMRAERPDIAIDLSGHSAAGTLPSMHLRVAPVQVEYIGYPCTSGVGNMDYRLVDSNTDPTGFEDINVEKLLRVDPCFFCYRPPANLPGLVTPPSARGDGGFGGITFGSFSSAQKFSDQLIRLWVKVLRGVPGSRVLIKHTSFADAKGRDQLARRFAVNGAPSERVLIEGPAAGRAELLPHYNRVDIGLDTFPYTGMTTTIEAVLMGVPVVSMAGRTSASRGSVPTLKLVGLEDLVVSGEEEYVAQAVALAGDAPRLAEMRRTLRGRLVASPICDEAGFTRRFETALRDAWRARCPATN